MGVLDQIETEVEAAQEPDDDRRDQDDREGALQEISGFFPEELGDIFRTREAIIRQFHDKRDGFTLKEGLFENKSRQNRHDNSQNVKTGDNHPASLREEGAHEKAVDRQLRRAGHKRREQNCHASVALAGERPGGHDRRDRAAEA